jgi:hypothetical protein
MIRLYADFNVFADDGNLPLLCKGSIDSMAALGRKLRDGEEVVLSDGGLEVVARVFRLDDGSWEARGDWKVVDATPSRSGE